MDLDVTGLWHNKHDSILRLHQEGRMLRGSFQPGVGPFQGETFEVNGLVEGRQIAFTVGFDASESVTTWIGHMRHDHMGDALDTLWQMAVRIDAAEAPDGWRGIWSGFDEFRRGEPARLARERRRAAWSDSPA